ncbi:MAG: exo-alpha-sialidase [Niameybacter sp.]|nr:exo-alpha-sialidase [Niameybacter sp.]
MTTNIFVSTNPNKLHSPDLAGNPEHMGNLQGCRIPSLLMAHSHDESTPHTLLAIADIGNDSADWGKVDIGLRRSFDNGKTWTSPVQTILSLPAHHAPQEFHDWHSAFYIDAVTTQAQNGDLVMVVDMWPECKGLHNPSYLEERPGYKLIDGVYYQVLYSGDSKVTQESTGSFGDVYTIREDGWIYDSQNQKTHYYIPQHHNIDYNYITMGDMYYAVGEGDYIHKCPPLVPLDPSSDPTTPHDIYVGNIYLNYDKPHFDPEHPVFVQKRHVTVPDSLYETYETDPAPLRAVVTSYLWVTRSTDLGATWSQPYDITPQVKVDSDGAFLGTGPGTGLTLKHQSNPTRNGRIIMPVYALDKAAAIYSDDNGYTWHRSDTNGNRYMNNIDESQLIELLNGDIISFGRQYTKGKTPISISHDGGETWSEQQTTDLISVRCQKSVITYPVDTFPYPEQMQQGKQYVLSSHPTGNAPLDASRTNGVISLGEVQEDGTILWIRERSLNLSPNPYENAKGYERFFGYSSLAVLENGHIGILYEPQPNNCIVFTSFDLNWLFEA